MLAFIQPTTVDREPLFLLKALIDLTNGRKEPYFLATFSSASSCLTN